MASKACPKIIIKEVSGLIIDISVAMTSTYTNGVWDDLFEGSVHQEVFRPYKDKALILLSGIMIDSADWYNS